MMLALTFAAALGWQFETTADPLGQPVYVASIVPDEARPFVAIKYACGGIVGVVLQFNLGDVKHAAMQFSTKDPEFESVRFAFLEGNYDTTAKRAPITDGLATYEIKGSEAAFVASLLKDSDRVTITRGTASHSFPLTGARFAIDEVVSACPFKYPDQ